MGHQESEPSNLPLCAASTLDIKLIVGLYFLIFYFIMNDNKNQTNQLVCWNATYVIMAHNKKI